MHRRAGALGGTDGGDPARGGQAVSPPCSTSGPAAQRPAGSGDPALQEPRLVAGVGRACLRPPAAWSFPSNARAGASSRPTGRASALRSQVEGGGRRQAPAERMRRETIRRVRSRCGQGVLGGRWARRAYRVPARTRQGVSSARRVLRCPTACSGRPPPWGRTGCHSCP